MLQSQREDVKKLLIKNRRIQDGYSFTTPSPDLYPFQWLWDSCFHTMMLAHFDIDQARAELRSVVARPLPSGLLPHIIYWIEDYRTINWGREMRGDIINGVWGVQGTSGITQPPLVATTVWNLHTRYPDKAFLEEMYPILNQYYRALQDTRTHDDTGLLGIINPDESGEDNSPRFDQLLNLSSRHTDIENLEKRIELMKQNSSCDFNVRTCMMHYFWAEDVTFNVIAKRGFEDLAKIADVLGYRDDALHWEQATQLIHASIRKHMCKDGMCHSLGGNDHTKIDITTWGVLAPLFGNILTQEEAATLVGRILLNKDFFWTEFPIPSVARNQDAYQPDDFWRGPMWMAINWFIYKGLKNYGFDDIARDVREKSIALVTRSGFREYYNPETGEGLGARDFTWGGLIIDME